MLARDIKNSVMFRSLALFANKVVQPTAINAVAPAKRATALTQKFPLTPELKTFMQKDEASPSEINKAVFAYAKKHLLMNEQQKREIICDEALQAAFNRKVLSMGQITKCVFEHRRRVVPPKPDHPIK